MEQKHLDFKNRINLGGYYTPSDYVNIVWEMIDRHITPETIILDSACGYGNFLNNHVKNVKIGCDLDKTAVNIARQNNIRAVILHQNSLININRAKFKINHTDQLCIIGNPPYNDKNSIIRRDIKSFKCDIDKDIKTRDLGISFLLSYNKLKADTICVLHPLSYLIKKSNFNLLKNFTKNYKLSNGLIINSATFQQTSKSTPFPIIIACYKRNINGMDYNYIYNFKFKTIDNKSFKLADFDYITKYIKKYPSKHNRLDENSVFFWTIRDINALKRNRTFVEKFNKNTIVINKNKLDYYIYIDVFKRYSDIIPYYFGNCDIMINNALFNQYKEYFLLDSITNNKSLEKHMAKEIKINKDNNRTDIKNNIKKYFHSILKEHYVR